MAAISYSIAITEAATGQGLEAVVAAANAPSAGSVEIRFDQTAGAVTDGAYAGGTRLLKKGEVLQLLNYLIQYLERDPNVFQ